jgi:hypothetical protein
MEIQTVANKYIIDSATKNNIKIIYTLDSHYPKREQWLDRFIYRAMKRMR